MEEKNNNIISTYFDNLANLIENDNELAEVVLSDEAIDMAQEKHKTTMLINRLETKLKAKIRKEKYQKALSKLKRLKDGLKNKPAEYIDQYLNKPENLALRPLFNKLGKLSESDIQSMVDDAQLLDLFDKIDENFDLEDE